MSCFPCLALLLTFSYNRKTKGAAMGKPVTDLTVGVNGYTWDGCSAGNFRRFAEKEEKEI